MLKFISSDFSIEKKDLPPSYTMKNLHKHQLNELFYMSDGNCTINIEDNIYKVTSGTFVLIPASCNHKTTYLSAIKNSRFVFYFSDDELQWFSGMVGSEALNRFMSNKVIKVPKKRFSYVNSILEKILYEQSGVDDLSSSFNHAYFYELILFMMRCQKYAENVVSKMNVENEQIQNIIEYICCNFSSDITLTSVSKEFNMSESSLSKKFKAFTGFRFKDYLIRVRIAAAENSLINTSKTITEIAQECGFSHSNAFGDTFKRIKGYAPSSYRKRC